MGIVKRAADLAYTFRFLKLLVTPFEKTKAFELGIIDKAGKRDKSVKLQTIDQKDAYTPFIRLVFNIKRLMGKIPGGQSSIASYAAALFLIKEKYGMDDESLLKILDSTGHHPVDFINEDNQWFLLEDGRLSPGVYALKYDKMINSTHEELCNARDKIRVAQNSFPVGDIFGLNVYEATHIRTNQKIYVTIEELRG